jgi:hypothetical protein
METPRLELFLELMMFQTDVYCYVPLRGKKATKDYFNNNKYFQSPIFPVGHPKKDTDNGICTLWGMNLKLTI